MDSNNQITSGVLGAVGGIFGGLLTLIGVRWTISQQNKSKNTERMISQLPALVSLNIELERIENSINNVVAVRERRKKKMLQEGKTEDQVRTALNEEAYSFVDISNEKWSGLSYIVDIDLQAKLIKFKDFYSTFINVSAYDLKKVTNKLIRKKINNQFKMDLEKNEKIEDLENELSLLLIEKQQMWHKFFNDDYQGQTEKLRKSIRIKIEEIQRLIN